MPQIKRINVIGTSGSGKSTCARRLANSLSIPYIEMDALFWRANWQHIDDEEFTRVLGEQLAEEAWVLDGNYTRMNPIKWQRVGIIVWVDYSFVRTCLQAIRRACQRAWDGSELWPGTGNKESFRLMFSRDSILLWTLRTYFRNRRRYLKLKQEVRQQNLIFVHLRSPLMTDALFEQIPQRIT